MPDTVLRDAITSISWNRITKGEVSMLSFCNAM
jgi:hypothetical protein